LERAFKPLVRQGRLGTASAFAARVRATPGFPPPTVDVVEAEVALRDGEFSLAIELAQRVQRHLDDSHPLKSRAHAIVGHSNFQLSSFRDAEVAFVTARKTSQDNADEAEALHGIATSRIYGEHGD